jgi:aspartyl-tRNA synthetase
MRQGILIAEHPRSKIYTFMAHYRTHSASELNASLDGKNVVLSGWVHRVRDHGGLSFFDLRDRSGLCQVLIPQSLAASAPKLRSEFVVRIEGIVRKRPEGMVNSKMASGAIEVEATGLTLLAEAEVPPFSIENDNASVLEVTRLKYRYLDLRREQLQKNLILRHKLLQASRRFFSDNGFLEVETPILYKSTPEGARDYLVPSRVHPGSFYALPQSPQTLKQLLMISGFERYFQVARCFRDEDLRADRQPEFTQLDLEVSFLERDEFLALLEQFVKATWKECLGVDLKTPFVRLSYRDAIEYYGSDKPDLRFGMKLVNVSELVKNSQFKVFSGVVQNGGAVVAVPVRASELKAEGVAVPEWSRKFFDGLNAVVAPHGLKAVAWGRVQSAGSWQSSISKFFTPEELVALEKKLELQEGDYVFFGAEASPVVQNAMGQLRLHLARETGVIKAGDVSKWAFTWVLDFPLFEYDPEAGRLMAAHHPFTRPKKEDEAKMLSGDPKLLREVYAEAYDLALNGFEIAGGSLRIFDPKVQAAMFGAIGFSKEEAEKQFGFFMEALKYGTPPHGGIAFGIDRVAMLMSGAESIRDVIAFPKTARASCQMSESPSTVSPDQLAELRLQVIKSAE